MHSLAQPSHQRGLYLIGCLQGTVSSVSPLESLPYGVPSPTRQLFCPFHVLLHDLTECQLLRGSGINLIVYSSLISSSLSSSLLDVSDEPNEDAEDEEDESESVCWLVAFGWP